MGRGGDDLRGGRGRGEALTRIGARRRRDSLHPISEVGVELNSLLEFALTFLILVRLDECEPEVQVRARIVRLDLDDLSIQAYRLFEIPQVVADDRKVEESVRERGIDVERESIVRLRRSQGSVRLVDRAEVEVGVLVVRVVDEDLTVVSCGLGEATGVLGGDTLLESLVRELRFGLLGA